MINFNGFFKDRKASEIWKNLLDILCIQKKVEFMKIFDGFLGESKNKQKNKFDKLKVVKWNIDSF